MTESDDEPNHNPIGQQFWDDNSLIKNFSKKVRHNIGTHSN